MFVTRTNTSHCDSWRCKMIASRIWRWAVRCTAAVFLSCDSSSALQCYIIFNSHSSSSLVIVMPASALSASCRQSIETCLHGSFMIRPDNVNCQTLWPLAYVWPCGDSRAVHGRGLLYRLQTALPPATAAHWRIDWTLPSHSQLAVRTLTAECLALTLDLQFFQHLVIILF